MGRVLATTLLLKFILLVQVILRWYNALGKGAPFIIADHVAAPFMITVWLLHSTRIIVTVRLALMVLRNMNTELHAEVRGRTEPVRRRHLHRLPADRQTALVVVTVIPVNLEVR